MFRLPLILLPLLLAASGAPAQQTNPQIDYPGFAKLTQSVGPYRQSRLLSWAKFAEAAKQPGALILDARSADAYAAGHIEGAVNLPFTDFHRAKPWRKRSATRSRPILIYCNNNFSNDRRPVAMKRVQLALNIQTFINLVGYGYPNVYELNEVIDFNDPKVGWVKSEAEIQREAARERLGIQPAAETASAGFSQSGMIAPSRSSTRRCSTASPRSSDNGRGCADRCSRVGTTTSRRLTFCRQFIRAVFSWPTKQPLRETDAVQLGRVAFEPEEVAELGTAFADAETKAMLQPAVRHLRCSAEPTPTEIRQARIGDAFVAALRPVDRHRWIAFDRDRAAQAVDGEALDQVVRRGRLAVEQQVVAVAPDNEIEQAFALRGQQAGPHRQARPRPRW